MLGLCRAGFAFLVNYETVADKKGWWAETLSWLVRGCHRWVTFPRVAQWVNGTNWWTENSLRCLVLKSRSCFLPKSCIRCSGFLSFHLFFWLHCQTALHPGSSCCNWFHCFAFRKPNPNPPGFMFIGGFSIRQGNFVVHTFTSKTAVIYKLPVQQGSVCTCVCVCVVSLT